VRPHRVEQLDTRRDVVAPVLRRVRHRLADVRVRREVEHGIEPPAAEDAVQRRPVRQVSDDQLAGNRVGVAVHQIVEDGHLVPGVQQRSHGVAAHIPSPARHQQSHSASRPEIPFT
jgi:hypothetical protein